MWRSFVLSVPHSYSHVELDARKLINTCTWKYALQILCLLCYFPSLYYYRVFLHLIPFSPLSFIIPFPSLTSSAHRRWRSGVSPKTTTTTWPIRARVVPASPSPWLAGRGARTRNLRHYRGHKKRGQKPVTPGSNAPPV